MNPDASAIWVPPLADPKELARTIVLDAHTRGGLLVFTDFERTLRIGPRNGRGGGLPLLARGALMALASTPDTGLVVASGQDACELEGHVNVPGLIYAGCRGLQIRGPSMTYSHPGAARLRDMLPSLAAELSACLASIPNVRVEVKELGIGVHVRKADASIRDVVIARAEALRRGSAREFRVWPSESTVDLFPDVDWGKGSSALFILEQWESGGRARPAVVYLGHDETDEDAYLALRAHGHAVHVGPLAGESAASYRLPDQAAAFELLAQIAFAWSIRPVSR